MAKDPRFPKRPDHPDFWRLSKVALAQDAVVDSVPDVQGKKDALRRSLAEIADPACVDYMAINRGSRALQLMGYDEAGLEMTLLMAAAWVDGFRAGVAYQKELNQEAQNAKET